MACTNCGTEFTLTFAKTGRPHKQCQACRTRQAERLRTWRAKQGDAAAKYQRIYNRRRRQEALGHYGGRCSCCGVSEFEFLTFDHAEGGGGAHRDAIGTRGNGFVSWLFANDFPSDIRVLCYNCNSSLGYWGYCPHQQ